MATGKENAKNVTSSITRFGPKDVSLKFQVFGYNYDIIYDEINL